MLSRRDTGLATSGAATTGTGPVKITSSFEVSQSWNHAVRAGFNDASILPPNRRSYFPLRRLAPLSEAPILVLFSSACDTQPE